MAGVVVPEERRELVDVRVRVGVVVVVAEEAAQVVRRLRLRRERASRLLEREVEHGLDVVVGRVVRGQRARPVGHLAEHEEVLHALVLCVLQDLGRERLPELVVDVLHGVDAEAVDLHVLDPLLVDPDHPVDHFLALGEEVVEPEEVAVLRVLADERRVAAVVVHRRVVQPRRRLGHVRRLDGRVGEALRPAERREGSSGVVAVVERRARGRLERIDVLRDVRVVVLLVLDDVRGVVGDDVEEDLHVLRVRLVDQRLQLRVGPEVRVDLREVRDPVAVVAGRGEAVVVLHRPVLEARGEPDRGRPEALDVVDLLPQAGRSPPWK